MPGDCDDFSAIIGDAMEEKVFRPTSVYDCLICETAKRLD